MRKLILFVLILLPLIGCSSPTTQSSQSTGIHLVFTLNGYGDSSMGSAAKTTQTFHINKFEWSIETDCTALDSSSPISFIVAVFPGNKPIGDDYAGIVSQTVPGVETNYIHGSGDYYLQIIGINVSEWSVKVYQ